MKTKVELLGYVNDTQAVTTAGALGCFEEKSSIEILNELLLLPVEKRLAKERVVLKNSFGMGHGSVGDQSYFIFGIENLPRLTTLELCSLPYLAHLQQSLRRAKADRGYWLPPEMDSFSTVGRKTKDVLDKSFALYEEMLAAGVPGEDARFILPLATYTNIQTAGTARELSHLKKMAEKSISPVINKQVVERMITLASEQAPALFEDYGSNYEEIFWYPSPQLFAGKNETLTYLINQLRHSSEDVILVGKSVPELFNSLLMQKEIDRAIADRDEAFLSSLKHVHFTFLSRMSLAALHQAIRQRTWDHSIEPISSAALRYLYDGDVVILPPSIKKSKQRESFYRQCEDMGYLFEFLNTPNVKAGLSDGASLGVLPHSLSIYTLVHVNGWNAIHSIGKRTCTSAQWEIRNIAKAMARIIKEEAPFLAKWCEPQCIVIGRCPEKEDCGYYKKRK